MNRFASTFLVCVFSTVTALAPALAGEPAKAAPKAEKAAPAAPEVTLKGMLGCGKCSFHEAKACQNVLKVKEGDKEISYALADNEVARANHEKVCGPASAATVTGAVSEKKGKKVLTASAITFE